MVRQVTNLLAASKQLVAATQKLHRVYGSTSVCYGGIGGSMITSHCGWTCENHSAHAQDVADYVAAMTAMFKAIKEMETAHE